MIRLIYKVIFLCFSGLLFAKQISFEAYLQQLRLEPQFQEFSVSFLDETLGKATYLQSVVKLDRTQPEFTHTVDSYLAKAVPKWKVAKARKFYQEHKDLLKRVGEHYGVQPRFIVALWGIETNFGAIVGNYQIISALATLAYDGRREQFFKKQLQQALVILKEGHVHPDKFVGSWAGAMGQVQFMPSSFLSYAVDFNKDNKKDLWESLPDIFASAANYLKKNGWDDTQTWARQVRLPKKINEDDFGLSIQKSLLQWQNLGVRRFNGDLLPQRDIHASLIAPDGTNGRAYLIYDNYRTLSRWNRSTHFVVAVGNLADQIIWPK